MPALIVLQVISSGVRLLEEALDVAVARRSRPGRRRVGFSTGVSTIVALALRSRCSAMTAAEIDLRQHVAVEHDDRLAQRLAGVADGAAGAERRRLDDVADARGRLSPPSPKISSIRRGW